MNDDDLQDFVSWKKNLDRVNSPKHFEDKGLKNTSYRLWKYQNDIGSFDERILIKLYEFEMRVNRLERVMLEAYEGEV